MSKDKESDRLELIRQNNQQPNNNQHAVQATNKESDRLQIIDQILAISSTILVGANAGVQLFHNLGQN